MRVAKICWPWAAWALAVLVAGAAAAQAPSRAEMQTRGEAVYKARCASCHEAPEGRTPGRPQLAARWGDEVVQALTKGVMAPMAAGLGREEIEAVAFYLTGWP